MKSALKLVILSRISFERLSHLWKKD